ASFVSISDPDRALIEAYVESYRPKVAVLGADGEAHQALRDLPLDYELTFLHRLGAPNPGPPFAAVVVLGDDGGRAVAEVRAIAAGASPPGTPRSSPQRLALGPRVVFAARADPATLVELLNQRLI